MDLTAVLSTSSGYAPLCDNGACETGEAADGSAVACPSDCPSTGTCPAAPAGAAVGSPGAQCGGVGRCNPATGACTCPIGHQGEACSECEYGFTPRGAAACMCLGHHRASAPGNTSTPGPACRGGRCRVCAHTGALPARREAGLRAAAPAEGDADRCGRCGCGGRGVPRDWNLVLPVQKVAQACCTDARFANRPAAPVSIRM